MPFLPLGSSVKVVAATLPACVGRMRSDELKEESLKVLADPRSAVWLLLNGRALLETDGLLGIREDVSIIVEPLAEGKVLKVEYEELTDDECVRRDLSDVAFTDTIGVYNVVKEEEVTEETAEIWSSQRQMNTDARTGERTRGAITLP